MSVPFVGEIRAFPFNFAPKGWASCDGQHLPIQKYQALYSIIGTTYGGDGKTTFALPDLRGRTPIAPDMNGKIKLGSVGGEETHALTVDEMPGHTHELCGASSGTTNVAPGNVWGASSAVTAYADEANNTMHPQAIQSTGSGTPHSNMQPYLALNFCIALEGIYPTRN